MKTSALLVLALLIASAPNLARAQAAAPDSSEATLLLKDMPWRDPCILPDKASGYYYLIGSKGTSIVSSKSKDLVHWTTPHVIFEAPADFWGDTKLVSIWAPELHLYKGNYYLFATFNTAKPLPEQWRNWEPRVVRGSQILVSDSIDGPFKPFQNHSTLPTDMMTLDATLWEEDGVPYVVFAHEWVQVVIGTIECMQLKPDLSETTGDPTILFRGNAAPWATGSRNKACWVTDGPYLRKTPSGRLLMIWSSFGEKGYAVGQAYSESGKLAGPWVQVAEPVFANDGGHAMLFETFDGQLMMVLHSPNREARPHLFKMELVNDLLKIKSEL